MAGAAEQEDTQDIPQGCGVNDPLDLEDRLVAWGEYFRWHAANGNQANSLEGNWRCPQPWWELPPTPEWMEIEIGDVQTIESSVCALEMYYHILLKTWYIRRLNEDACLGTARKMSGVRRRREDFRLILGTAKALLVQELARPAVVRKQRASAMVRAILGLEPLTAQPIGD